MADDFDALAGQLGNQKFTPGCVIQVYAGPALLVVEDYERVRDIMRNPQMVQEDEDKPRTIELTVIQAIGPALQHQTTVRSTYPLAMIAGVTEMTETLWEDRMREHDLNQQRMASQQASPFLAPGGGGFVIPGGPGV